VLRLTHFGVAGRRSLTGDDAPRGCGSIKDGRRWQAGVEAQDGNGQVREEARGHTVLGWCR
jgi:hypothetical protein